MTPENLMAELRDATRDAHQRLENLPFAQALSDKELPLESYVGYLRAMAVVHSTLEHELPVESDNRIAAVWDDAMRKLPALQRDLDHFAPQAIRDIPAAHTAAESVAHLLLKRSTASPLSMLGYLYVLEGSTLGARVLAPWARQTFDLSGDSGLAYLQSYGDAVEEHWHRFRASMDRLELSKPDRSSIVEAALEAFEHIGRLLEALYPFDPDKLIMAVTTLNPEAGSHPIPQDPREIDAARRAGERCLLEYPYFVWRYGERGRRFTDSDGAWLATLVKYPQPRIDRQVVWLGGVLAPRGMPRLLLQRHLELLYEELRLRVPHKQADYEKLVAASDRLAMERRACIGDDVLDAISRRFDHAVDPDWRRRLSGTGAILVSAVADERAGLAGTLENVQSWFSDPARFPPQWVTAVRRCIAEAQSAMDHIAPDEK